MPKPDPPPLSLDQIRALLDAAWASRRSAPQDMVGLSRQVLEQPLEEAEFARATLCLGCGLLLHGEFGKAEPELRRALQLYGELADQEGRLNSLNVLGTVKARQGRSVEALELFLQVRHLSVKLGSIEGEANALLNIGATYINMGDHPNALRHHLLTLEFGRRHDLPSITRRALNNLSVSYNGMRQYGDALEAALTCLNLHLPGEPMQDTMPLRNAGVAYFGLKQLPEAQAMYLKASVLMEQAKDQGEIASLDLLLGRVAQHQSDHKEAKRRFERSLKICQNIGDELGQATSLQDLGELLAQSGQVEDALNALHRARTLAEKGQFRDHLSEIELALSRLYQQARRPHEALTHLEQHLYLRTELFNAESDQRLQSLRVEFGLEQAERERLAAQRQNAELTELNARLEATNRELTAAQTRTAELMARLEQHANEDALTGLPNRRAFDAALERVSPSQQISVVLCDIDHFKAVNDRFSHLVGDEVLRHVAALLRGQLHRGDLLARYGGEEFVLLLAGASEAATLELCENLRRVTENHDWCTVRPGLSLTISLGAAVAQLNPGTLAVQDVVQAADDALYAAKNAGRNRVEVRQAKASAG